MIYFVENEETGEIKIGTSVYPEDRLKSLQSEHKAKMSILAVEYGDRHREQMLHRYFSEDHLHGEWFYPSESLMQYITAIGGPRNEDGAIPPPPSSALCKAKLSGMELEALINRLGGQSEFARKIGTTRQAVNAMVKNRRPLGPAMAIRIFHATGVKLGPLADSAP